MKPVLLDTSVLVALLDRRQRRHRRCIEVVEPLDRPLLTCEAVIAESCYLLRNTPGAPEAILKNVAAGIFDVRSHLPDSASAIERQMRKYRDRPIDFADACLIQLADTLNTGDILTLDHDFLFYRWRGTKLFNLLVSLD